MNLYSTLILASKSPRRQQLLKAAGFDFEIRTKDVNEDYSAELAAIEVAPFLAQKKADAFLPELDNEILLTADTVVIVDEQVLGKPADYNEAFEMIELMSGRTHVVCSGVCIADKSQKHIISDTTEITFKTFSKDEIDYYITNYKPYDKAGAYGIQEWIGMTGVIAMNGSFYNVAGLPVHKVYDTLINYFQ